MIIDGRKIADEILTKLKQQIKPDKILVAVLVGTNPAAISFLKQKGKTAQNLGVNFKILNFPEAISENELISKIKKLNSDSNIGAIIIQLPLPDDFDRDQIINAIDSKKDVDNLNGSDLVKAPAVATAQEVLKAAGFSFNNKNIVIVGRGLLVGAPIAQWLKGESAHLTLMDSKSFDANTIKKADLIISGVGKPGLITGAMIKEGVGLIDFGYANVNNSKLSGDFDFNSCISKCAFITPTPGGTGPILVVKLFENFYKLTAAVADL